MDCSVARVAGLCAMAWMGIARGQQFEVASVKPSREVEKMPEGQIRALDMLAEMMRVGGVPMKGSTVSVHSRTLAQLVAVAHRVKPSAVTGPNWISELRYDVDAKPPAGTSTEDLNAMLLHLLEERFGLKTHVETKTTGGYALVVGKAGPKLTAAAEAGPPADQEEVQRRMQERMRQREAEMRKSGAQRGGTTWSANRATGEQIAEAVGRIVKAPVTDETGLTGKYDVKIELAAPESPDEAIEYRMSLALEKLGLKLESKKAEVKLVVVDAASKTPTEN